MGNLMIFENAEFGQIRTVDIENEPWFVGKDVAAILGYAKPLNALATHIDEDDSLKQGLIDSMGRKQETILINESGLYSLILSSKLPTAKKFKHWVTSEVLPSIRKNGGYIVGQETLSDDELMARALLVAKNKITERDKRIVSLETEVSVKDKIIGELKPRADYAKKILNNSGLVAITQIAKDYGMSGQVMNELLHDLGVQYKKSGQWLLYSKYHGKGYVHSETVDITHKDGTPDVRMHTKWTQRGRLFLYELLKRNGYLPVIEQQETGKKKMADIKVGKSYRIREEDLKQFEENGLTIV